MARLFRHTAQVVSEMEFPIDFLRVERALPATEEDSRAIARSIREGHGCKATVVRLSPSPDPQWQRARWASFGVYIAVATYELVAEAASS